MKLLICGKLSPHSVWLHTQVMYEIKPRFPNIKTSLTLRSQGEKKTLRSLAIINKQLLNQMRDLIHNCMRREFLNSKYNEL